jgi:hypothetical protein
MPKKIGGRIYAHKDYIKSLSIIYIPEIIAALQVVKDTLDDFTWNTVRIKPDAVGGLEEVSFQYSPDFDTADEPEVVQTITCVPMDNTWEVVRIKRHTDTIWHHKWMWVEPNYKGFDYEASKARSALWKKFVSPSEIPKIGRKSFWDKLRVRWEN